MKMRNLIGTFGVLSGLVLIGTSAEALTTKECSAKYKAAQTAGTLGGMKWNDFRKAQCGKESAAPAAPAAAPASAAAAAPAAPATAGAAAKPAAAAPTTVGVATKPATTAPEAKKTDTGTAVFPTAVSAKYSKESTGKARMHTCLDQYNTNKASGGNGGLVWIKKGGGYYSECNKRLSG